VNNSAFAPTAEGEARLLLLIDAFSKGGGHLQGRVKLAKLDFLLRYPSFFERAMKERGREVSTDDASEPAIEQRMVRYRYGPWDPAYYELLGRLIGRGLITPVPQGRYIGLRVTEAGHEAATAIADTSTWSATAKAARILRTEFREQRGSWLKDYIYRLFPEVAGAEWGKLL
jgi:hypothetical protein